MASAPIIAIDHDFHNLKLIYKVVEESLDFTFQICNNELEQFTLSKIFDVFNQTLPTAVLLNTGFWPLYNNMRGQSLCICGRYGFECRHLKNSSHWIDLQSPVEDDMPSTVFYPKYYGDVHPVDYFIQINPDEDFCVYTMMINMRLQYKKADRGRKKVEKRRACDGNCYTSFTFKETFTILARYSICQEYYNAFHAYVFQPSPIFHEFYGHYFFRLSVNYDTLPYTQNCNLIVSLDQIPTSTLRLTYVNLNTYEYVNYCTLTVFPLQFQCFKLKCTKFKNKKRAEEMKLKQKAYMRNFIMNIKQEKFDNDIVNVVPAIKVEPKVEEQPRPSCSNINPFARNIYNGGSVCENPRKPNVNNVNNVVNNVVANNNFPQQTWTKEEVDKEFDIIDQWIKEDIGKQY